MSGLYSVNRSHITSILPHELESYVTQGEWSSIYQVVQNMNGVIQTNACLVEGAVCFVTCFFCIFFCHPVIVDMIANQNIPMKLSPLNHSLYNGQPVIGYHNQCITINLGLLSQMNRNANNQQRIVQANAVYAQPISSPMVATAHVEPIHASAPIETSDIVYKH